jgi:hypothetical protein
MAAVMEKKISIGEYNMNKIAICVSGQTRHFNDAPQYTDDFYKILDLFSDYDYDLFGHTWADQEDPHDAVLNKFVEYRSDNQEVIWDTINNPNVYRDLNNRPMWPQFFTTEKDWHLKPEYQDMLNGISDTSYIDFAKARINGSIGQIWSAMESFLLTKNHWDSNRYMFVVRLRWDSTLDSIDESQIKQFKEILWQWAAGEGKFSQQNPFGAIHKAQCLTTVDCVMGQGAFYTNDMIYVFKGHAFLRQILSTTAIRTFEQILSQKPIDNPFMSSAHQLWAEWLINLGLLMSPQLPDFIRVNGPGDDNKPNKKWRMQ